ncbi:putative vacuolar import/degradation Vid27 [Helianthus annuus]|nr:putative vacuolar import/degradation Vid27 [Helianthus annuus]KAJ0554877.1 putative vacuolar import/degradation Vid27 [Helianthus annuus]KAJ0720440.1 putative vacuolar import/degradation Vid27 [Helianthus annuus]
MTKKSLDWFLFGNVNVIKNLNSESVEGLQEWQKALLTRGETNMLLMCPENEGKPHSSGVNQLDIETGKIVTKWKFEKDGTDITMREVTNDTKGSQLDPSESLSWVWMIISCLIGI